MSFLRPRTYLEEGYLKFRQLFQEPFVMILILLVFCSLLFILGVGRWDLWDPDEPRYAQVAKEMVNGGDWILMHVNGKIYEDKPPLFFWLIGLSSFLWQGFTSFSVRFPGAFLGTLTVILTFFLGKKLYTSRTGFLSGLILATSFEFAYLSIRADIDATLTFFTTASLFCFLQWCQYKKGEGGEKKYTRSLTIYGFYISMALATLGKGPVGFILPLLVSLIYLLFQKDWEGIKGMRIPSGMVLFLAIVLSWYLPAIFKGGETYLNATLFHQIIDRFAKGTSHVRPFYYYFANFPADFLPWFLFLPGAIVLGLSEKKAKYPKEFLFLLIWFLSIFLFFSFSKGKRAIYLLPLYPAASLLVGRFWDTYISGSNHYSVRKIWVSLPIYLFAILFFFMGIILYLIPIVANFSVGPPTSKMLGPIIKWAGIGAKYLSYVPRESVVPFILLLLGSNILLFLAHGLKYRSAVFTIIVVMIGIAFFYGTRVIFPLVNPFKSARFISQDIKQIMKPEERLAMYGDFGSGGTAPYNFYTGIVPILEIESEKEMIDFLHTEERVFCILKYQDYEKLNSEYPGVPLHFITHRRVGHRDIAILSNQ
jgi:4-amino-4-deoxy-L-arabinose transferase-like glycosyltransferase